MEPFRASLKQNVGPTSEKIRECAPKTIDEWREYYFTKVSSKEHIEALGKRLYRKITGANQTDITEITEKDCVDYITQLVIDRTFDSYMTEIRIVYEHLEKKLGVKIEPAPDDWGSQYNVDFFIEVKGNYIGIQIKPVNQGFQSFQTFKENNPSAETQKEFTRQHGGKIFSIFSFKLGKGQEILNIEVVDEIRDEIRRLNK